MSPKEKILPSQGEVMEVWFSGSSIVRAPGLSSRVKKSLKLRKEVISSLISSRLAPYWLANVV